MPADVRHPVFRAFGASRGVARPGDVSESGDDQGAGCQTLARFTTGEAALVECAPGDGRALVFASDLDNPWNDFPLHATFVPFLHEAVRYLAGRHARVGDYLVGEVPAGVAPSRGLSRYPSAGGSPQRRVAINVDPRESDPVRLSADEFQTAVTRLKDTPVVRENAFDRQQEEGQQIWRYVLMVMIAALVVESFVGLRTA